MSEAVVDFPRGGTRHSEKKPEKIGSDKLKRSSDVLFGTSDKGRDGRETKRVKSEKKKKDTQITTLAKHVYMESFSYKYLKTGFLLLGYVKETNFTDMVVGLANGLNGYIPLSTLREHIDQYTSNESDVEDSDDEKDDAKESLSLQTIVRVGNLIPVVVKKLHGSKHGYKKIELSIFPTDVNINVTSNSLQVNMLIWGVVTSIEDHGYMVSLGIKDVRGFVPKKDGMGLKVGMLKWFAVKKTSASKKVLTLSLDHTSKSLQMRRDSIHFNSLLPGQSVKFTISQVSHKSISGKVFGSFEGFVELVHVPDDLRDDMANGMKVSKKNVMIHRKLACCKTVAKVQVTARILHINTDTKQIGLSCLQNILSFPENVISSNYKLGEMIKGATITRTDNNLGLFVEMPDEALSGHIHISRISEERVEKINLSSKFKVGKKVKCRVLGYSGLESSYVLTMLPSDLIKDFTQYEDLKPGMIVSEFYGENVNSCVNVQVQVASYSCGAGTPTMFFVSGDIITLEDFGCLVKITDHIRALLPRLHLADIILQHPEKKYTEGKKVKCRVLTVDAKTKKLTITHKKTMVNSEHSLITNYDDVKPLTQAHGFITSIKTYGLFVTFYNNISALVPKVELVKSHGMTWEKDFYAGQVVQCTILSINGTKITATLKDPDSVQLTNEIDTKKSLDAKFVELRANHESILVKTKKQEDDAIVMINHLTDFNDLNKQWKCVLQNGVKNVTFKGLMFNGKDKETKKSLLSGKSVLIESSKNQLTSFSDLKVDGIYGGVVTHIMPYGVFVQLSKGITGLVPLSKLSDSYVNDAKDVFSIGQSVIVKVTEVDEQKRRFLGSTVSTDLRDDDFCQMFTKTNLLECCLQQRELLHRATKKSTEPTLRSLPDYIGEVLLCKLTHVNPEKISVEYHDEDITVNGIIPSDLKYGVNCEVGDELQVCVIDIDLESTNFIGTLNPELIKDVIDVKKNEIIHEFSDETKLNGVITRVTNGYVNLTLPTHQHCFVYMNNHQEKGISQDVDVKNQHLNDMGNNTPRYRVNRKVTVVYVKTTDTGKILVRNVDENFTNPQDIMVGSIVTAVVKGLKPCHVTVSLGNGKLNGRLHVSHIFDSIEEGGLPLKQFQPSQTVQAKVIGFRDLKKHNYLPITHANKSKSLVELSMKASVMNGDVTDFSAEENMTHYMIGQEVLCYVTSLTKSFIYFAINPTVKGRMYILNATSKVEEMKNIRSKFKPGSAYTMVVIGHDDEHHCVDLSTPGVPTEIVKSAIVVGKISKILPNVGILINLPNQKAGIAHLTELYSTFVDEPLRKFSVGNYVRKKSRFKTLASNTRCVVLNVKSGDKIDLSLRESRFNDGDGSDDADRAINSYDDLKEGDILRGYIKTCSKVGVFVSLSPSITGRVQLKNISQYFVKDYEKICTIGKLVKARILSIDPSSNKIDLSLRGKDVDGADLSSPPKRKPVEDSDDDGDNQDKKKRKVTDGNEEEAEEQDSSSEESDDDESDNEQEEVTCSFDDDKKPSLKISSGFDWSVQDDDDIKNESDDSDSSDEESKTKAEAKKTKRQKRAAKKAEEDSLHQAELALLDTERQLESAEDYDRVVLSSPNSSIIWIQYMAFHLHMAEVEKARSVAQRAIKTISFREEQEKLNVWVALLNLENMYGTEDSLNKTMKEAIKVNDYKKITLKMIDIYCKAQKHEAAEKLYNEMLHKHSTKSSKAVWVGYAYFLAKKGDVEKARDLLSRSLKSIPQRKHIETIVQFAILEYKFGESQRGATILESILKNYPKRTDLWSVYIDMATKEMLRNMTKIAKEQVRNIFERAITINLSLKKMKFLYKRYMEFEKEHGTSATVDAVRKKAESYVENRMMEDEE